MRTTRIFSITLVTLAAVVALVAVGRSRLDAQPATDLAIRIGDRDLGGGVTGYAATGSSISQTSMHKP